MNNFLPITTTLLTTADRTMFLWSLKKMEEEFYRTKEQSLSAAVPRIFPKKQAEAILSFCKSNAISLDDFAQVEQLIKTLTEQVTALPVLSVTLSFEPSEETINLLATWVQSNIGHAVLLDIHLDKTILGGAILEWRGIYKDFSLLKKVDSYFKER